MKSKLDELKKLIEITQSKYQMPSEERKDLIVRKLLNEYFIIDVEVVRSLMFKKNEAEQMLEELKEKNNLKEYILFHEKDQPLIIATKNYFANIHQFFSNKLQDTFWITPGRLYTFLINPNCQNEIRNEEGRIYLETIKSKVEVDQLPPP